MPTHPSAQLTLLTPPPCHPLLQVGVEHCALVQQSEVPAVRLHAHGQPGDAHAGALGGGPCDRALLCFLRQPIACRWLLITWFLLRAHNGWPPLHVPHFALQHCCRRCRRLQVRLRGLGITFFILCAVIYTFGACGAVCACARNLIELLVGGAGASAASALVVLCRPACP